jgi:hypothetical protein
MLFECKKKCNFDRHEVEFLQALARYERFKTYRKQVVVQCDVTKFHAR